MKATGIVRRIDDLGRVVIPKEIRRTMRIREGDPLEVFVDREGSVILRKYSPIGELSEFSLEYGEALFETTGKPVMITDRDSVIAVAGGVKDLRGKRIGPQADAAMENRKKLEIKAASDAHEFNGGLLQHVSNEYTYYQALLVPIVSQGQPVGSVIFFTRDKQSQLSDIELKLAETAAAFLGKQMAD